MSAPDFEKRVLRILNAMNNLYNRKLPVKVGAVAVAQVKENFRQGGIDGVKWDEPYRRKLSFNGAAGKYGPLLSSTGTLRSANKYKASPGKVLIENRMPYASIQNEGGLIRVTAKMKRFFWAKHIEAKGSIRQTKSGKQSKGSYNEGLSREAAFWRNMALKRVGTYIRIPHRKFLGESRKLNDAINKTIANELQKFVQEYGKSAGTPR